MAVELNDGVTGASIENLLTSLRVDVDAGGGTETPEISVTNVTHVELPPFDDSIGTVVFNDGTTGRAMSWNHDGFTLVEDGVVIEQYPPIWIDPPHSAATVYYVDATSGSDSNNGLSTGAPVKTLTKVNTFSLNAGDEVLFKRGETWTNERLYPTDSGTAENCIKYGAYGVGEDPVFDGNNIEDRTIYVYNQNYLWFDHLQIINCKDLIENSGGLAIWNTITGITVTHCNFQDNYACGLGIRKSSVDVRVGWCRFVDNGKWGYHMDESATTGSRALGFIMAFCWFEGNTHLYNGGESMYAAPLTGEMYGNTFVSTESADVNCYLGWNAPLALDELTTFSAHHNFADCRDLSHAAITSKGFSYEIYANCMLNAGTSGADGRTMASSLAMNDQVTLFHNNVVWTSDAYNFCQRELHAKQPDSTLDIYLWNNTMAESGLAAFRVKDATNADILGFLAVNNLISNCGAHVFTFDLGPPVGTMVQDYNYVFDTGTWGRHHNTNYTLAEWRAAFNLDLHSTESVDPLFANDWQTPVGRRDFTLHPTSRAIGFGTDDVPRVTTHPNSWIGINFVPYATSPDAGAIQTLTGKTLEFRKYFMGLKATSGEASVFKLYKTAQSEAALKLLAPA